MAKIIDAPYIRATTLIDFSDELKSYGFDAYALLRQCNLPSDAISIPDTFISYRGVCKLYELAAEQTGNQNFGLDWLLKAEPDYPAAGPMVILGRFAKNMREWVALCQNYWLDSTNAFKTEMIEDTENDTVTMRFHIDPLSPYSRQMVELMLGNSYAVAKMVCGRPELRARAVKFQHQMPASIISHTKIFGCPLIFNADYQEIVFDREILDFETSGGLRLFKALLGMYVNRRIRQAPKHEDTIGHTVALAIGSMIGTGRCNLDFIAIGLGMSTKKLQRLLEKEQITFSAIFEEVRHHMAKHLLVDTDIPIVRIASLLDYTQQPAFTIAFKRWTDLPPIQYRNAERAKKRNASRRSS